MGKGGLFKSVTKRGSIDLKRFEMVKEAAEKNFKPGANALEVGCNDGTFAAMIANCGYETIALDVTPYVQVPGSHRFIEVDAARLHFPFRFDLIHAGEVLEHVKDPDALMRNIARHAGGLVLISVPDFKYKTHLRTYSEESAREQIEPYLQIDKMVELKGRKKGKVYFAYCKSKV